MDQPTGDNATTASQRPRLALWALVLAGPALRTSMLGGLLVAQDAIGEVFHLSASVLAILVACIVFGGLVAVFLLPPLIEAGGIRRVGLGAAALTVAGLALGMLAAPTSSAGVLATAALFIGGTLLGVFGAALSPISQALLNAATSVNPNAQHALQSVWSAGQPVGFVVASVAGGFLVEQIGWWMALAVPLAFAVVAAVSLLDRGVDKMPAPKGTVIPPRLNEIFVIVLALTAFQVWSSWGSLKSWIAPGTLAAMAAMIVVAFIAIRQLLRSPQPVVSLAPFSAAGFAAATLILLIYQFPTTAEFEVLLLTELDHVAAEAIGDRTAIGNVGQIAGTALGGALLRLRRIRLALAAGFALTIIGLATYIVYPWLDSFAYAATTRTIAGFGGGLLLPVLFVLALDRMPVSQHLAAGTWLVLATIGGTEIGLALFSMVLEITTRLSGSRLLAYVTVEAGQVAVGVIAALLTIRLAMSGRLLLRVGVGRG